jgi:hypothetical protein
MLDSHKGEIARPVDMLLAKAAWLDETIGRIDEARVAGRSESEIVATVMGGEAGVAYISGFDLSRRNFVRAVMKGRAYDQKPRALG